MGKIDLSNDHLPVDILQTKFVLPQIRLDAVSRSPLLQRLTESVAQSTLTLVSASAGFGKTTLLSLWGTIANTHFPTAWISLDEGDNISTRFWTYVITALRTLAPACGEEALALLRLPQPPSMESILVALLNTLMELRQTIILILDDFHVITNPSIHDAFAFFLDHLPPHVHITLAARKDPLLPLHRLRARGQLVELRTDDLRFTIDEVATFFQKTMHLDLPLEDITELVKRTEGWVVGLQLAALSLREQPDSSAFIASFTGNHRFILDYLAREILNQQESEVQDFLLATSILDRLTMPLCNAITGRDDGQMMLEQLEQANLFLIPLDHERRWYRYHRLFAEFLRERLRLTYPDRLFPLYRRASAWCEENELTFEAITYALHAGHFPQATDLIERAAAQTWTWGKVNPITHYLEILPTDVVRSRPQLCIYQAWRLAQDLKTTEAEKWLQEGERQLHVLQPDGNSSSHRAKHMLGEIFAIRTLMMVRQNDMAGALACYQQANELLATTSTLLGPLKYAAAYALSSLGDDDAACRCLEEDIIASQEAGNDVYVARCYVFLACLQMSCGHMHRAALTCQQALRDASVSTTGQVLLTGAAYFSFYELHYEWNNLEDAQRYITKAIEHAKQTGDVDLELTARLALPNLLLALGQREQARQLFEEAYRHICMSSRDRVSMVARESRVRLWLEMGDIVSATRWAAEYTCEVEDERNPLYIVERMALAQVYLAQRKTDEALKLLERPLAVSKLTGRLYYVVGQMSLQALSLHMQGATHQALNLLAEALALGEPEGLVRVFADFGQPMAELLVLLLNRSQDVHHASKCGYSREYLLKLLSALHMSISKSEQQEHFAPVSVREREVLHLIADGLSTKEVARLLVISEGTVKTHMKRIYAKLEVKSRTQAVARARIQGLL